MAVNFSTLVYAPNFEMFSRPIVVTPSGGVAYSARGIYDTRPIDVQAEDGSIVSEQQTILDVRDVEFASVPTQLDYVNIPFDAGAGEIGVGDYEILAAESNGGGETTLVIRKLIAARPA
jgi:hypothetical protein